MTYIIDILANGTPHYRAISLHAVNEHTITHAVGFTFTKKHIEGGLLHYLIKLGDGRIWKRHIDQLRKVGPLFGRTDTSSNDEPSFVCEENETVSDTHNDAIAVDIVPPSVRVPENDNLPKSDHITDDNNLNQKKDIVEPQPNSIISSEQTVNVGVRHSTRIRKIPQRLNL
ncbi:hypothetical protein QE152_g21969 [Popillia japonica]|uniref:Uncharacterized protein n=1 Tax=Popillia japonica TaxID=7064 RepID=A0AAW1KNK1_POPJA